MVKNTENLQSLQENHHSPSHPAKVAENHIKFRDYCQKLAKYCQKLTEYCSKLAEFSEILMEYCPKLMEFFQILATFWQKTVIFAETGGETLKRRLADTTRLGVFARACFIVALQADSPTPPTPPTPMLGVEGVEGVGRFWCITTIYHNTRTAGSKGDLLFKETIFSSFIIQLFNFRNSQFFQVVRF